MNPREQAARRLFARIAGYYDLLNTVITFGLHKGWRRRAVRLVEAAPGLRCLDVCAGTGDFCRALPGGAEVTALDMTPEMLAIARRRCGPALQIVLGDALHLPFADGSFDRLTLGFGLRHSESDLPLLLQELARVTAPGGWLVCLEMSHPPGRLWRLLSGLYVHLLLPVIGGLYDRAAYRYLSESLTWFPDAPGLARLLTDAGFAHCDYHLLTGGVAAIHVAHKAPSQQ